MMTSKKKDRTARGKTARGKTAKVKKKGTIAVVATKHSPAKKFRKKLPSLSAVDAYPVPEMLVERVRIIYQVPREFAEGLFKEAKRMLYLVHVAGDSVAPSRRVDWAWHEMLMFTRFYRDFSLFIGGFIHHDPNPMSEDRLEKETWEEIQRTLGNPRAETDTYRNTKANYKKYFGEKPEPLFWP